MPVGVHFDFVPNPVVFRDGEVGPKGAAIFVYDNDVWEPTKAPRIWLISILGRPGQGQESIQRDYSF